MADKKTIQYRKNQFDHLDTEYSEYNPKIKIIKPNAETNWMDISESELEQIIAILTQA